jgi:hypothetical protein
VFRIVTILYDWDGLCEVWIMIFNFWVGKVYLEISENDAPVGRYGSIC